MLGRHLGFLAITVLVGVAGATACAGPPAGLISFTEATASSEQNATEAEDDKDKDKDTPSGSAVNSVFQSKVYPSVQKTCESCHLAGVGGAPIFFGDDAAETYALFKKKGYNAPNNAFLNKPVHNGPALTDEQKALVNEWIAAEGGGSPDGG